MSYLGVDSVDKMFLGSTKIGKAYLGNDLVYTKPAALPYDSKVEYLRSTGTQYILLNITPHQNIKVEIKWKNSSSQSNKYLFGSGSTSSNCIRAYIGSSAYWRFGGGYRSLNTQNTTKRTAIMDKNGISINGTSYSWNGTVGTFSSDTPFCLFAGSNGGTPISTDIFYYKVWDNNVEVLSLEPVRVGQIGYMYDSINNVLWGNDGSGSFGIGNDIS